MNTDWIPSSILKLIALCRIWLEALVSSEARTEYHWDAGLCTEAEKKIRPFIDASKACESDDSSQNLTRRKETRATAVIGMREFAASSIRNNPYMTDADREKMGLRKSDAAPTPHKRPESQPITSVERTLNYFEHRIKALNTAGRNAKPDDAYGVRFVWQLGGERPESGDEILKGKFSRRPVMIINYNERDQGKMAYYASCYENAKGEAGPWSPVVAAKIS
jgi:hypothetical protein